MLQILEWRRKYFGVILSDKYTLHVTFPIALCNDHYGRYTKDRGHFFISWLQLSWIISSMGTNFNANGSTSTAPLHISFILRWSGNASPFMRHFQRFFNTCLEPYDDLGHKTKTMGLTLWLCYTFLASYAD